MKPIGTFAVVPLLPEPLSRLQDIAYNLRWAWHHETRALFRRLDMELWETSGRNPVLMLGKIDQARLDDAAADAGFMAHYDRVCQDLDRYVTQHQTWYRHTRGGENGFSVAYFSAEFAVTDCLPIYSGGLAVLAGDHLKSASNLGLPLIGVGLLYQEGYFRQYLNADGWQQEAYCINDFYTIPLMPVENENGHKLTVNVPLADRHVVAKVWRADVGRIPLYLLDTNLATNSVEDRSITNRLYGGDRETRIKQEIVLGIGGMKALSALSLTPNVCHMNEGHTAFLAVERVRQFMENHGLGFDEAREAARASHVFTNHTPVAAGNDYFSPDLVDRYLGNYYPQLGLDREAFLALGRQHPRDPHEAFCMTVLALRLSCHNNAVSRLHETVTRAMWAAVWPEAPEPEVPISHVTNAVHVESWISHDLASLFDTYLGLGWREQPGDHRTWERVSRIPSEELWRTHERRRERLIAFSRERLRRQLQARGVPASQLEWVDEVLDPGVLTIGFGRRFATYKRPTLLQRDPERLAQLLNNERHPVQIIIAGKAHPQDDAGKELIRNLIHLCRQPAFRKRMVYLEDYDLDVARYMVQGVDIWLNTPRRLMEASGTSGMKAAVNGVPNVSILDGWWDEAYTPEIGWAIGQGELYDDEALQDQIESDALYDLLEKEVVPLFYQRGANSVSRKWVAKMKAAMTTLCPRFNTHRMVREYTERYYLASNAYFERLAGANYEPAKNLAAWKKHVTNAWHKVRTDTVTAENLETMHVGDRPKVQALVRLGDLTADDVEVQLCLGRVDSQGAIIEPRITTMAVNGEKDNALVFEAVAEPCTMSGRHGYAVRILPHHPDLSCPWDLGLVHCAT